MGYKHYVKILKAFLYQYFHVWHIRKWICVSQGAQDFLTSETLEEEDGNASSDIDGFVIILLLSADLLVIPATIPIL